MSGPSKRLKELTPIETYLKTQGQFKHLFKPEWDEFREQIQAQTTKDWETLWCRIEHKL